MNNTLNIILTYTLVVSIIILLLSISYHLIIRLKQKKRDLNLREYELNISSSMEEDIFGLLDKVIQEAFNEYTVLNIEYHEDITYIDAELEKIITQEVAHKVIDRISPALISKISLVYNIANLDKLLSERTYLCTLHYVLSKNAIKE